MNKKKISLIIIAVAVIIVCTTLAFVKSDAENGESVDVSGIVDVSGTVDGGELVEYDEISDRLKTAEEKLTGKVTDNTDSSQNTGTEKNAQNDITGAVINQAVNSGKTLLKNIPEFSGKPYCTVNGNVPTLKADGDLKYYENYSPLDGIGRCGVATACLGKETMPTEERGEIGSVKPSGWHTVKYDCVDGKYLYNRCHLIGFQLSGENANKRNLITGTRYMNIEGMLPFENMVADYIKETGNHVLYRVTPVFCDDELVARGVQMEALSVEDNGDGICFNVYCYNNQPGVTIDYATGNSELSAEEISDADNSAQTQGTTYILNTKSKKIHLPSCSSAKQTAKENKKTYKGSKEDLLSQGYTPCGKCNP